MERALVLEIPEQVYSSLLKTAEQTGRSPEEVATQWLLETASTLADDPLERFIGFFNSTIPDWADAHDRYLGKTIQATLLENTDD